MEIYSDSVHNPSGSGSGSSLNHEMKKHSALARTPLVDVKNLTNARFDSTSTPKQPRSVRKSRKSRCSVVPAPPSGLVPVSSSSSVDSVSGCMTIRPIEESTLSLSVHELHEMSIAAEVCLGQEVSDTAETVPVENVNSDALDVSCSSQQFKRSDFVSTVKNRTDMVISVLVDECVTDISQERHVATEDHIYHKIYEESVVDNDSTTATVVDKDSTTATVVDNDSTTATVVDNDSTTATVVDNDSTTAAVVDNGSTTATVVDNGSTTATVVDNNSTSATVVDNDSTTATVVDNDSTTATVVDKGSTTATVVDNDSTTATGGVDITATLSDNTTHTSLMGTEAAQRNIDSPHRTTNTLEAGLPNLQTPTFDIVQKTSIQLNQFSSTPKYMHSSSPLLSRGCRFEGNGSNLLSAPKFNGSLNSSIDYPVDLSGLIREMLPENVENSGIYPQNISALLHDISIPNADTSNNNSHVNLDTIEGPQSFALQDHLPGQICPPHSPTHCTPPPLSSHSLSDANISAGLEEAIAGLWEMASHHHSEQNDFNKTRDEGEFSVNPLLDSESIQTASPPPVTKTPIAKTLDTPGIIEQVSELVNKGNDNSPHMSSIGVNASTVTDSCAGVDVSLVTDNCNLVNVSMVTDTCAYADAATEMNACGIVDVSMVTDTYTHADAATEMDACSVVDVSMVTESVTTQDCSMSAVVESMHQETMTEMSVVDAASSMTPLKLGKHGGRLTAEEVRRQHPRVIANQIETTMLTNARLEKEVKALKLSLKEAKSVAHEKKATITRLQKQAWESESQAERQRAALQREQESRWEAEQALHSYQQEMEERCRLAEEGRLEAEAGLATQLQQVAAQRDSYQRALASAQQKIREMDATQQEYTLLFGEMEHSYTLMEQLKDHLCMMKNAAENFSVQNTQLKEENEWLNKRIVSREVDLDVAKYEYKELLQDNTTLEGLLSNSNLCVEKLQGMLDAANSETMNLQDEVAERLAQINDLTETIEELNHSKARTQLLLSEKEESLQVVLEALHEAEGQLRETEEQLDNERQTLAAEKVKHEEMKEEFDMTKLKLEMERQHLQHTEKLLNETELRKHTLEQDLFDLQEQLFELQDVESSLRSSRKDIASGLVALHGLHTLMDALFSTLNNKLKDKNAEHKMKSSTPKEIRQISSSAGKVQRSGLLSVGQSSRRDDLSASSFSKPTSDRAARLQQSNVEFGAMTPQSGADAAAMLSPHSQTFCCPAITPRDVGVAGSPIKRLSVSFTAGQSRRELFKDVTNASRTRDPVGTARFAKIRAIPTSREEADMFSLAGLTLPGEDSDSDMQTTQLAQAIKDLKRLFGQVVKVIQLTQKSAQMDLQDARDETNLVKEQVEHEASIRQDLESELAKRDSTLAAHINKQKELQNRVSSMTKSIMEFHDQQFKITRLEEEKRDMKWKLTEAEGQCSLLSEHLEAVVKKLDAAMNGQTVAQTGGISLQETIALKKENNELMMRIIQQKEHHKDLGDKAVKRMKVLEHNWKKAESEVNRLDQLLQEIRECCVTSHAQRTHPLILGIVRLMDGKISCLKDYSRVGPSESQHSVAGAMARHNTHPPRKSMGLGIRGDETEGPSLV